MLLLLRMMHTHVFGPNFQEKKPFALIFEFKFLFIHIKMLVFLYYKGILAFIFEHIMVQEILCHK